ncbi:hypothetical protein COO60DRAFT_901294 [Scenedesmus sp. NREL 46B-D3]|nr:hypothetical protein COO60DRAFT_901294 [Scenedesmus sp. NREL 46B-D3]
MQTRADPARCISQHSMRTVPGAHIPAYHSTGMRPAALARRAATLAATYPALPSSTMYAPKLLPCTSPAPAAACTNIKPRMSHVGRPSELLRALQPVPSSSRCPAQRHTLRHALQAPAMQRPVDRELGCLERICERRRVLQRLVQAAAAVRPRHTARLADQRDATEGVAGQRHVTHRCHAHAAGAAGHKLRQGLGQCLCCC